MTYVIIDLEFNNMKNITKYYPKFYEEHMELEKPELDNEIIEIGAIKLDKFMRNIGEFKRYITPKVLKILNPNIIDITGIEEKDLKKGIDFCDGIEELKNFVGKDSIICSWAKDDITEIIKNANYHKYKNLSWIKEYIDIQEYATKILAHKNSLSLKHALEELKIKIDTRKLHDALNDAIYTGEVFKRLYNNKMIKNHIVKDIYNMPAIKINNLKSVKLNLNNIDFTCPRCRNTFEIDQPFKAFSWRFLAVGTCPKCKCKLLNEIVIKKTLTGEEVYSQSKTILNDIEYMNYLYKLEKAN